MKKPLLALLGFLIVSAIPLWLEQVYKLTEWAAPEGRVLMMILCALLAPFVAIVFYMEG